MTNAEYHVGAGVAGIYAGKQNESRTEWLSKSDVTNEAIEAIRDYFRDRIMNGETQYGIQWQTKDGRKVSLICEVEESCTNKP